MGISSPLVDLQHQYDLLQKEYEYEKETYRQQSERTGLRKRVAQGLCWYPVTPGRSYYNSLNQLVIEIERTEDREIEHNFEYGRPVCFFTADISGKFKYLDFSATISYVQEDRMVVVLPTPSALMDIQGKSNDLGVQLYFDETSYKTMFSALSDVMRAKNNQLSHLRDVLLGQEKPGQRELFPIRFPWLNRSQEEAVNKVLGAKQVSIVHGPPGTGKTTTLVEAIYETLHRENQVIVCAQSNTAVSFVAETLTVGIFLPERTTFLFSPSRTTSALETFKLFITSANFFVLISSSLNSSRTTILLSATFEVKAERRASFFSFLFILNE